MKDQLNASRPETAQVIGFNAAVPMAYFRRGIPNPRMNESGSFRQCLGPRTRQIPLYLDSCSVDWHRRLPKECFKTSTSPVTSDFRAQAAAEIFPFGEGSAICAKRSIKSTRDGTSTLSLSVRVDPEGRSPKRHGLLSEQVKALRDLEKITSPLRWKPSGLFDEKFPAEGRWPSFFDTVSKPISATMPGTEKAQCRKVFRRERSILDWSFPNMSASEDRGLDMRPLL